MQKGLADPHKGNLDEGRRRRRIKNTKRLRLGGRGVVPQDARWGLVQMCGAGGGPEKIERSTQQDLQVLRRKLAFTADFKGQASIGQVWVKTQVKSKPGMGPASL